MFKEVDGVGPGLISTSPARRRIKEKRVGYKFVWEKMGLDDNLKRKWIGIRSRHLQTDEKGKG